MKKSILVLTVLAIASIAQARSLNQGFENQSHGRTGRVGGGIVQTEGETSETYHIDGDYAFYHFNFDCRDEDSSTLSIPHAGEGDNEVPEMNLSFAKQSDCQIAERLTNAQPHCKLVTIAFDTDSNELTLFSCKH